MLDVVTFGEALVDMPATVPGSLEDAPAFEKVAAGAPANVAAAMVRLGGTAGFVGKAGADPFGRFLKKRFAGLGVDVSRFQLDPRARTGLAFVAVTESGERDFQFYFDPGADMALSPEELDRDYLGAARLFHFGTLSLIAEPVRSATFAAAEIAAAGGAIVSLDANLRPALWPDREAMRRQMRAALAHVHVAKLAEEELQFLYPGPDIEGVRRLLEEFDDLRLVAVTYGAGGSVACTRRHQAMVRAFPVRVVDTTGAGDAFVAALLRQVAGRCASPAQVEALSREELREMIRFANAAGALSTTGRGATAALPTEEEVRALLADRTGDQGAYGERWG